MCDVCTLGSSVEPDEVDYCACPLWEPCSCGAEAPVITCHEDMHPWLVDRRAEITRRRLACHKTAS
jgi:hypothetical protein